MGFKGPPIIKKLRARLGLAMGAALLGIAQHLETI